MRWRPTSRSTSRLGQGSEMPMQERWQSVLCQYFFLIFCHTHTLSSPESTTQHPPHHQYHQWFIMASFSSLMAKTRQRWQLLWAFCRLSVDWQCLSQTHWQTHCKLWIISWISWLWLLSCLILNRNRKSGKKMMISRFIWSFGRIKLCWWQWWYCDHHKHYNSYTNRCAIHRYIIKRNYSQIWPWYPVPLCGSQLGICHLCCIWVDCYCRWNTKVPPTTGIKNIRANLFFSVCHCLRHLFYCFMQPLLLGTPFPSKTDEFSEKFQTAFDPPPSFSESYIANFFWNSCPKYRL